jgi:ArsR family transcriptional regulator, arsenate/arsenite/antimonite-responsive transcriptional repressor
MKAKCCENKQLTKAFQDMARFLRIIGDDNRLKILCLLRERDLYVDEIVSNLGLAQNLVSSHLKVLSEFNLIIGNKEGRRKCFSINKEVFKKYNILLNNFLKNYE